MRQFGTLYMLNVKLQIDGDASFEIIGEVQIMTVDYLQLKKVQHKLYSRGAGVSPNAASQYERKLRQFPEMGQS